MTQTKTQKVIDLWNRTQEESLHTHIINNWNDSKIGLEVILGKPIETDNYQHLAFMADSRTVEELIEETVRAWIIEDIVMKKIDAVHNGSDSERKIAKASTNITTEPDLTIGKSKVEVVADYGGYWSENGTWEIRANKWDKLKSDCKIFGFDLEQNRYFLIKKDHINSNDVNYIDKYWPYGGKSVYSIDLDNFSFSDF